MQDASLAGYELVSDFHGESLDTDLFEVDDSPPEPIPNLGVTNQ